MILFEKYPDIERAYALTQELSWIFTNTKEKIYGLTRLAKWCEKVEQSGFKAFNSISRTINNHYKNIINYFDNRSTNASAESFNAKIKAFRSQHRGVRDVNLFLFRLAKLYAFPTTIWLDPNFPQVRSHLVKFFGFKKKDKNFVLVFSSSCGERGIRTLGTVSHTAV